MTLIVGILCEGGVAIASDRAATSVAFVPLANPQHLQTSVGDVTKVTQIGNDAFLAVAGVPAIGIEYEAALKKFYSNFVGRSYEFATTKLKEEIRKIIEAHLTTAQIATKVIGPAKAYSEATIECLLAANFKNGPHLIQIQRQGAFDVATPELPLRVIGSGQMHADPFLLFLRNTFWPNRLPTVEEGVLAACWAVHYAIETGAPMVGKSINAFWLRKDRGKIKAHQATETDITTHRDFIEAGRMKLRELAMARNATPADARQVPVMDENC